MAVIYVPASIEAHAGNQAEIYVKPIGNEQEKSVFKDGYRKYYTADSTVLYGNINCGNDFVVDDEQYTKCVPVLGPAFMKLNGIKIVLVNCHSRNLRYASYVHAGIGVICDSGGFQLVREKLDFIDPIELAKMYNRVCNIGMDLDIPDMINMDRSHFDAIARIQKANYEAMKTVLHKNVHICLVNHGKTIQDRERWYELVDRSDPQYISVAGLQRSLPLGLPKELQQAEHIIHTCYLYPNAKYIHVLGTTTPAAFYIYSLIEQLGLCRNIGADSTSYTLTSISGMFNRYFDFSMMDLPQKFKAETKIPCSCPVCSTLHDFRLLGSNPIKAHSLIAANEYVQHIYKMTKVFLAGDISSRELLQLTKMNISEPLIIKLRDYVQECTVKFKPLKNTYGTKKSLFGKTIVKPEVYAKYEKLITNYEKYYKKRFR